MILGSQIWTDVFWTSVVAGGIATIVLALSWTRLFPSLAGLGRLEDIRPEPVATLVR